MSTSSTASRRRHGRRGDEETAPSWSDLPDGPLLAIATCLCSFVDFISFKSVCRSWRNVASSISPSLFPPLLLFPTNSDPRAFDVGFSVRDPASPSFSAKLRKSKKFQSMRFHRYSHGHVLGWLENRIVISNLFNGDELYSPLLPQDHQRSTPECYFYLVPEFYELTSPLSSPDAGLLVYTRGPLLYWHVGSASWSCHWPRTTIPNTLRSITVQGKVYAVNCMDYNLFVLDFSPKFHLRPLAVEPIEMHTNYSLHCLVDCGGELLSVRSVPSESVVSYERIEVFRLDFSVNRARWVKKDTLGNWAIFVVYQFWPPVRLSPGLAVENPERWGGRSNHIYFNGSTEGRESPFLDLKLGDEFDKSDPKWSPLHHLRCLTSTCEWFHPGL